MRQNMEKVDCSGRRGTAAGLCSQRRGIRPMVIALESRTLLATWYVNSANSGPADGLTPDTGFTTIQAGIDSSSFGDTVLVETGNGYNESDTVDVPDLTIEADSGQTPVLDGSFPSFQGSSGFTITTFGVTIAGFTIQNFSGPSAVQVQSGSSVSLNSDVLQGNFAFSSGGGLNNDRRLDHADQLHRQRQLRRVLRRRRVHQRRLDDAEKLHRQRQLERVLGGGLTSSNATTTLSGVTISGNSAVIGGGLFNSGFLTVQFSNFGANRASLFGGARDSNFGNIDLLDSGFTGNSAGTGGAVRNTGGRRLDLRLQLLGQPRRLQLRHQRGRGRHRRFFRRIDDRQHHTRGQQLRGRGRRPSRLHGGVS